MANINLLPWREERREALKKAFLSTLALTLLIAVAFVIAGNMLFSQKINHQEFRNSYLQQNIDELSEQVKEIKEIHKRREELLTRMEIIQNLQGNRPVIVRVFDELVRTLPDGVFYEKLQRTDEVLFMEGVAESPSRISSLMRRADRSDWFADPNLSDVTANKVLGEQAGSFKLTSKITTPKAAELAEDE